MNLITTHSVTAGFYPAFRTNVLGHWRELAPLERRIILAVRRQEDAARRSRLFWLRCKVGQCPT